MCVTSNRNRNRNSNETKQTQKVTKQEEKQPQSLPLYIIYIPFVSHKYTPIPFHNPHTTPTFHPLSIPTPMPMPIPKSRVQKEYKSEKNRIPRIESSFPFPFPSIIRTQTSDSHFCSSRLVSSRPTDITSHVQNTQTRSSCPHE